MPVIFFFLRVFTQKCWSVSLHLFFSAPEVPPGFGSFCSELSRGTKSPGYYWSYLPVQLWVGPVEEQLGESGGCLQKKPVCCEWSSRRCVSQKEVHGFYLVHLCPKLLKFIWPAGSVPVRELSEMKARLFLNLGLVHDHLGDSKLCSEFIRRSVFIAEYIHLKQSFIPENVSFEKLTAQCC